MWEVLSNKLWCVLELPEKDLIQYMEVVSLTYLLPSFINAMAIRILFRNARSKRTRMSRITPRIIAEILEKIDVMIGALDQVFIINGI